MPRVSLEFYFNLLRERKRGRQYDRRFQILSILHMCFLWLMFSVSMSNIDKYMVISQNVLPFIEPNNQNKRKNLLKITKYNCNCFFPLSFVIQKKFILIIVWSQDRIPTFNGFLFLSWLICCCFMFTFTFLGNALFHLCRLGLFVCLLGWCISFERQLRAWKMNNEVLKLKEVLRRKHWKKNQNKFSPSSVLVKF